MSVGGGFKKGKAEFAMKDIDGHDIKTATESFGYVDVDKVLTVNGVDINSSGNGYGIYFRGNGYDYNIYSAVEGLFIDGECTFSNEAKFDGGFNLTGPITDSDGVSTAGGAVSFPGKPAYLSCDDGGNVVWSELYDVHCWKFQKGPVTLYIYMAVAMPNNDANNNLYTYFANVPDSLFMERVNKLVNIRGSFSAPYSGNYLVDYNISRTGTSPNTIVQINLTLIGRDSTGSMNVQTITQEIASNSYQNGTIVYQF